MSPRKISLPQLVEKAGELFRINGYHRTSISDIAKKCGLSKASLYHHIASKKELATLVIKQAHQTFREQFFNLAYDETLPVVERFSRINSALEHYFNDRKGGSLVANLAHETCETDHDFKQMFQAYFDDWIAAI